MIDASRRDSIAGDGGTELAVDRYGDPSAPAVLFFHGSGQTRHSWKRAAVDVADRGWHSVNVDLRGHGASDWPSDGGYAISDFAADVLAVGSQFDAPVLVGASLGGLSSLVAIGELGLPARALALIDITTRVDASAAKRILRFMSAGVDGFDDLDAVAAAVSSYLPERQRRPDLASIRKNVRQRPDGRWVWHWDPRFLEAAAGDDPDDPGRDFGPPARIDAAARGVTVPTLLVRGTESDVVREDSVARLRSLIPHTQLAEVARAGHMVAGDRNDAFVAALLEFLDALDTQGTG